MKILEGSGNVYADLKVPDPDLMLVKARIAAAIMEALRTRGLTQTAAAKIVGLSQPKLSNILRGRFRGVSELKLMDCLTKLGSDVDIVVRRPGRSRRAGRLKVVFA